MTRRRPRTLLHPGCNMAIEQHSEDSGQITLSVIKADIGGFVRAFGDPPGPHELREREAGCSEDKGCWSIITCRPVG